MEVPPDSSNKAVLEAALEPSDEEVEELRRVDAAASYENYGGDISSWTTTDKEPIRTPQELQKDYTRPIEEAG